MATKAYLGNYDCHARTEDSGCPGGCTWTDVKKTICSNPACVKA
jgi:hypothetical protein